MTFNPIYLTPKIKALQAIASCVKQLIDSVKWGKYPARKRLISSWVCSIQMLSTPSSGVYWYCSYFLHNISWVSAFMPIFKSSSFHEYFYVTNWLTVCWHNTTLSQSAKERTAVKSTIDVDQNISGNWNNINTTTLEKENLEIQFWQLGSKWVKMRLFW